MKEQLLTVVEQLEAAECLWRPSFFRREPLKTRSFAPYLAIGDEPRYISTQGRRQSAIGNIRNAVFCDGDRISFLLPDDVVRFLHPPSGFGADVKMEVLPLSLEPDIF